MSVAAAPEQCYTSGIVTQLSFRGAMLMQSNLGAQGGRCQSISWADGSRSLWNDLCVEPQPGTVHVDYTGPSVPNIADSAAPTGAIGNQHVLFRGLGTVSSPTSQDVIWCVRSPRTPPSCSRTPPSCMPSPPPARTRRHAR